MRWARFRDALLRMGIQFQAANDFTARGHLGKTAIGFGNQGIPALRVLAAKPRHRQRRNMGITGRQPAGWRQNPGVVILGQQAIINHPALVGVGSEGEAAEFVGHKIVTGRGFTFPRVEEQQLLEIGMRGRTAEGIQQGKQMTLAIVEHEII